MPACAVWQAYELTVLTGTEVMLLVASETGHVYTFATRKLQPMITSENGKALIQTCLNSPDSPASELNATAAVPPAAAVGAAAGTSNTDRPEVSPVRCTAASHVVNIPQPLPLLDHSNEKLQPPPPVMTSSNRHFYYLKSNTPMFILLSLLTYIRSDLSLINDKGGA